MDAPAEPGGRIKVGRRRGPARRTVTGKASGTTGATGASASQPRIVVVGGGFAAIKAAQELRGKAEVTVVAPRDRFTYLPLVHELVSEESHPEGVARPLSEVVEATLVRAKAERVEADTLVVDRGPPPIPFDRLIVAIGAETHDFGVTGVHEHAMPVWGLEDALAVNVALKSLLLDRAGHDATPGLDTAASDPPPSARPAPLRVIVVGGGATGLEVAGEVAGFLDRYQAEGGVEVLEMADQVLPGQAADLRAAMVEALRRLPITLRTGTRVHEVRPGEVEVRSRDGAAETLRTDLTLWCAGIRPRLLPPLSMEVDAHLRSTDRDDVFLAGDCARHPRPVPRLAQTAEPQGALAARNALASLAGRPLEAYEPRVKGTLLSVGPGYAVGDGPGGLILSGKVPWHVKREYYKWNLRRA